MDTESQPSIWPELHLERWGMDHPVRKTLPAEFDVSGPWDDRNESVVWLRCQNCGCTKCYEEGDSEMEELLVKGWGIPKMQKFCVCGCHHGISRHTLLVKREVR